MNNNKFVLTDHLNWLPLSLCLTVNLINMLTGRSGQGQCACRTRHDFDTDIPMSRLLHHKSLIFRKSRQRRGSLPECRLQGKNI